MYSLFWFAFKINEIKSGPLNANENVHTENPFQLYARQKLYAFTLIFQNFRKITTRQTTQYIYTLDAIQLYVLSICTSVTQAKQDNRIPTPTAGSTLPFQQVSRAFPWDEAFLRFSEAALLHNFHGRLVSTTASRSSYILIRQINRMQRVRTFHGTLLFYNIKGISLSSYLLGVSNKNHIFIL